MTSSAYQTIRALKTFTIKSNMNVLSQTHYTTLPSANQNTFILRFINCLSKQWLPCKHIMWHLIWNKNRIVDIGCHKVGKKIFPEFSMLFQSHNYTFPEVIATKHIRNNDLHISRVIPHQLLLLWLTRACRPVLCTSTVFVHQIQLIAYGLFDTGCTRAQSQFSQRLHRIPWVFYVQRNPQVFQVCGHPEISYMFQNLHLKFLSFLMYIQDKIMPT